MQKEEKEKFPTTELIIFPSKKNLQRKTKICSNKLDQKSTHFFRIQVLKITYMNH